MIRILRSPLTSKMPQPTRSPADGSITLNVTPVNDAPLATNLNQSIGYTEGDLSVTIADIVISDLDTGETITANTNPWLTQPMVR